MYTKNIFPLVIKRMKLSLYLQQFSQFVITVEVPFNTSDKLIHCMTDYLMMSTFAKLVDVKLDSDKVLSLQTWFIIHTKVYNMREHPQIHAKIPAKSTVISLLLSEK